MASRCLFRSVVLLAVLIAFPAAGIGAEPTDFYGAITSSVQFDGTDVKDARVFVNAEKTVFLVCIPGEYVYKVYRKDKKVSAIRRPSVFVKPDKCRPMEGAKEQPIEGHLYTETKTGFSFNDLKGHKVSVTPPPAVFR